jgi:hypothetical protein
MGSDDLLSSEASTTYHRAYELASELARGNPLRSGWGHRTTLAEHWVLDAILARMVGRLDSGNHDDPAIVRLAIRDAFGERTRA